METVSKPITAAQIQKIHVLISKMGMSDRTYRQRLGRVGVRSCKELTFEQAKLFIYYLAIAEARSAGRRRQYGSRSQERITDKQMAMIRAIWNEVTYLDATEDREAALNSLVENKYHVSALCWLPKRLVPRLKRTLDAMKAAKSAAQPSDLT